MLKFALAYWIKNWKLPVGIYALLWVWFVSWGQGTLHNLGLFAGILGGYIVMGVTHAVYERMVGPRRHHQLWEFVYSCRFWLAVGVFILFFGFRSMFGVNSPNAILENDRYAVRIAADAYFLTLRGESLQNGISDDWLESVIANHDLLRSALEEARENRSVSSALNDEYGVVEVHAEISHCPGDPFFPPYYRICSLDVYRKGAFLNLEVDNSDYNRIRLDRWEAFQMHGRSFTTDGIADVSLGVVIRPRLDSSGNFVVIEDPPDESHLPERFSLLYPTCCP